MSDGQISAFRQTRSAERRRTFITRTLDVANIDILEIGPLDNPTFHKSEAAVCYLDWLTYEQLVNSYDSARKKRRDCIVHPDVVANGVDFASELESFEPFHLVVANHVLEHLPNPIRFLNEAALITREGGCLLLSIPDRRFTFDVNRADTDFVEWFRRYEQDQRSPDRYDLIRHFLYKAEFNRAMYDGGVTADRKHRTRTWMEACSLAKRHENGYADVHVSVFTVESFLALWSDLESAGLVRWKLVEVEEPLEGDNEFRVAFRKSADA